MYKPYDKKFGNRRPTLKLRYRLRPSHLKFLLRKLRYCIKYHTNYEAAFSLDVYSLEWLYYHLWRFVEDASKIIDMKQEIYINNKPLKLREACEMLMGAIKETLDDEEIFYCSGQYLDNVSTIFAFYGKLAPYLWY